MGFTSKKKNEVKVALPYAETQGMVWGELEVWKRTGLDAIFLYYASGHIKSSGLSKTICYHVIKDCDTMHIPQWGALNLTFPNLEVLNFQNLIFKSITFINILNSEKVKAKSISPEPLSVHPMHRQPGHINSTNFYPFEVQNYLH